MLQTVKHILNKKNIVLASSSPRRREILSKAGLSFAVHASNIDEDLPIEDYPEVSRYTEELAKQKTTHVLDQLLSAKNPVDIVIGADTVIVHEGKVFGKPKDCEDAFRMLSSLSGKSHEVITGVCIAWCASTSSSISRFNLEVFHEITQVHMADLDPSIIDAYVSTNEPLDKSGAYGIQDLASSLITGISGDYFTVMGLPVHQVCYRLYRLCKDGQFEDSL